MYLYPHDPVSKWFGLHIYYIHEACLTSSEYDLTPQVHTVNKFTLPFPYYLSVTSDYRLGRQFKVVPCLELSSNHTWISKVSASTLSVQT